MNSAAALPEYSLRPRAPDRMGSGFALAIGAHLLLLVALGLGVSWRASEPVGIEAELWAAVPQVAAPKAVEPEPEPPPKPVEPPKPVVEPPKPVQREADIATEKARKEREQKAQREKEAQERKELEKKKAEEARKKAEQEKTQQEQRLEAERKKNLDRMMGQLGGTGAPNSTGTAAQSAGPSAGYAGRIVARVKPNIVFTDPIAGDPVAVVEVKVAPDGTIIGRRITKASGQKEWDDAVLRAIDRTEVLPRDVDGRVPPTIEIRFRARDF